MPAQPRLSRILLELVEHRVRPVGAAITFTFPPEVIDLTLTGPVLAADEPKLLSFTWGEDEILRFELHPDGDGTRLVLTDQLRAAWAARNAAGWEDCLDRLAGLSPAPDAWKHHFDAYSAAFEPVLGPQAPADECPVQLAIGS